MKSWGVEKAAFEGVEASSASLSFGPECFTLRVLRRTWQDEAREIRAPSLLIWSQTRCHCPLTILVSPSACDRQVYYCTTKVSERRGLFQCSFVVCTVSCCVGPASKEAGFRVHPRSLSFACSPKAVILSAAFVGIHSASSEILDLRKLHFVMDDCLMGEPSKQLESADLRFHRATAAHSRYGLSAILVCKTSIVTNIAPTSVRSFALALIRALEFALSLMLLSRTWLR